MRVKVFCNAYSRSTKKSCIAKALSNGKCRNHGGLSTGPKTIEGKRRIALATQNRMVCGQKEKAQEGFKRWIEAGGRDYLSRIMIARWRLKK